MLCKHSIRKSLFTRAVMLLISAAMLTTTLGYSLPLVNTGTQLPFNKDTIDYTPTDSVSYKAVELKITPNRHVAGFVKTYTIREAEFLEKMQSRSRRHFPAIEKILSKNELPEQLKYLAIVESKLQTNAMSSAGARGLWQLMPQTAKGLGLRISARNDERLHAYRSTWAAAKYLRDLYAQFGDWLLVLAAYNSGPGPVYKAIKKAGSKNYWTLQRFLPAESRGHVKRFIAIHYYFEGQGSITTQTKVEAKLWQEKIAAEELRNQLIKTDSVDVVTDGMKR